MSVPETLRRTGTLDDEGARLLYECVAAVARAGNFPPPPEFGAWTSDAVRTVAHDLFASHRGPQRISQLALASVDDASFVRQLQTMVRNHLRDEARRTVVGRQVLRIKEVLADVSDAVIVVVSTAAGEAYALPGTLNMQPYGGDLRTLVQAAQAVRMTRQRWRPDARREGPLLNRDDTIAFCRHVLAAAGAPLTAAELAQVLAARFALGELSLALPLDVLEPGTDDPSISQADAVDTAEQVLAQLTERERMVLSVLDEPVRTVARAAGIGKTTAAATVARLKTLLQSVLPPGDDGAAVLRVMIDRIRQPERT